MECSAPMAICIVNHGPKLGGEISSLRWPPLAAATAAVRCANRILQINTNTGEVDLIGGCLNFICFQMFTLMFIDLFTFL